MSVRIATGRLRAARVAAAIAVVVGACAPIARADPSGQPLETLTVNAGQITMTRGTVELQPGLKYTIVASGTFTSQSTTDPNPLVFNNDPLYCYEAIGNGTNQCAPPSVNDQFYIGVGTSKLGDIDDFTHPGGPDGSVPEIPYQASHSYQADFYAPTSGVLVAGGYNAAFGCGATHTSCFNSTNGTVTVSIYAAPQTVCKRPGTAGDTPPHDPSASTAAINEVHVVAVQPDVQFHKGGTCPDAWLPLEKDTVLKAGDEISCDPDGAVTLAFADNSTVVVRNTTQLKIGSFFTEGGVVRTEILLKMGEVAAQVNKSEATKSDFRIKEPSEDETRGARDASAAAALPTGIQVTAGSAATVFYDPGSKTQLVSVRTGKAVVTPKNRRLPLLTVHAGHEVEYSRSFESPVAAIGKAGARGGNDILIARNLALAVVAQHTGACQTNTPRTNAFSIATAARGWLVSVKLQGGLSGTATFLVKGAHAAPTNNIADTLVQNCAAAAATWSGTWQRTVGVTGNLILSQAGTSVTGRYTWSTGGTVSGTVSGATLNASFNETYYSGTFTLTLSGKHFTGSYSGVDKRNNGPISGPLNGTCTAGACLGNGG